MNTSREKRRYYMSMLLSLLQKVPFLPKWAVWLLDMILIIAAFLISYFISLVVWNQNFHAPSFHAQLLTYVLIIGFCFYAFRVHISVIRYFGLRDIMKVCVALLCAGVVLLCIAMLGRHYCKGWFILPISGIMFYILLEFAFVIFFKISVRLLFDYVREKNGKTSKPIPVLLFNPIQANIDLTRFINHQRSLNYKVIGFISMDEQLSKKHIFNLPVYNAREIFHNTKIRNQFAAIVINPQEIDREDKQWLSKQSGKYGKDLLATPSIRGLDNASARFTLLKKLKIEDLLQRIPIEIDMDNIARQLHGKTVMITGAAGSIGSEIVNQVCKFNTGLLLMCDIAESPLHEIGMEVQDKFPHIKAKALMADVRDYDLMKSYFETYRPDVIYHAAAYKHVPLMEEFPCEAILTNVMGSKNIADLAAEYNAEALVMISTDKAVNPSNVMGASKRLAEMYVQSLSKKLKEERGEKAPRFIITRFGNVLGSNGSVIPRFEQQINSGGPITITHPDIIRYFMTITEACRLVLDAGNFGKGGEVFVFDMGEPVQIKKMAEEMIRLSGYKPYINIDIVYTGLRPGEKLYEELLYDQEALQSTHNKKIKIGIVKEYDYQQIASGLETLLAAAYKRNVNETVLQMKRMIPEFISHNSKFESLDQTT